MPTLFRLFGFRFFYRLFDLINEPCHVHVGDDGRKLCKYWIRADGSIELADAVGLTKRDLTKIERALLVHMTQIQQSYENNCQISGSTPNYYQKKAS